MEPDADEGAQGCGPEVPAKPGPASELYRWNLRVSEAFHPALQCLEVTLRNALHDALKHAHGRDDWWTVVALDGVGRDMVAGAVRSRAAENARRRPRRRAVTPDDIVAELPFGFWVSLLSRGYDRTLWVPVLHKAFRHYRGPRRGLHGDHDSMRLFRNRIMHHEPIHHRHLEADHETILRLLGFLNPDAVAWPADFDTGLIRIRPREELDSTYLALYLASPQAQAWMARNAQGSAVQHLSAQVMRRLPVRVPPPEALRQITGLLKALNAKISAHRLICETTAELRDALLPLLLSGQASFD